MPKPIDLGRKYDDDIGQPISITEVRDKVHYPDFFVSNTEDTRLLDMPDEGEATIRYKVVSRNHSEDKRNGKIRRRCSITIEVHSIEPPEPKGKNKESFSDGTRRNFADYFKDK